ncbi:pyruvate, phosphate dikinase [Intrasporangium calvum]|uniref:Pyruvate, phosphate dikinase n=1 Tax=Intrasporangium calvum (strain ATCC 23552 / DSM 43043 / JCM 3097 / NBRC 12989 / NCIMB 10167 / NRRL B-3866 / 7 KIP) TaxID=710696 RepID=E6SED6_INTC7|nr:pyruvate, phosphate dikinase [Intrasporangium calvum]ADU49813.1 pyruvate phosphate dikinase [Intrasporangium calvum DSM 43043]
MTATEISTSFATAHRPLVIEFHEGDRTMADLLGGKGAGLAEMTRLGLPVPPGFIVTTEACRAYLAAGGDPEGLWDQVDAALADLEERSGLVLGDPARPLLVSVRSGAKFSMPGMMETVLDIGLNDAVVAALAERGESHFAWDSYRRLAQMYGRTVLGVEGSRFDDLLTRARAHAGVGTDAELDDAHLQQLATDFRALIVAETGQELPQDAGTQLREAVRAVFRSWNGERARLYRAHEGIPDDLGTAVNVVQMVFGNRGDRSGSGVCFTRDPVTGAPGAFGDYLPDAQGEDVVSGVRSPMDLSELHRRDPEIHAELSRHLRSLETHYRDLCDVEFTVERGRLWILQTRLGKRSPAAAFRIAVELADEGVIDLDEALTRVNGHQLTTLLHPSFQAAAAAPLAGGLAASPGAAVGQLVFDAATAMEWAGLGRSVVLARPETSPDDFGGMLAAKAVITSRGGLTSHAAVVARGLGKTCVTGIEKMVVDPAARTATFHGSRVLTEGTVVSVDGSTGELFEGSREIQASVVATAIQETSAGGPVGRPEDPTARGVLRLLEQADKRRTMGVRANAETPEEARTARRYGAEGIGLCRTEHMLMGPRRQLVERVVTDDDAAGALAEIEALALDEFTTLLTVMEGLPVVVRLLDPPLHEFLPDLVDLSVSAAVAAAKGEPEDPAAEQRLAAVRRLHEANPMLGLRGVRLLLVHPEVAQVQVRALAEAVSRLLEEGRNVRPELMLPLVAEVAELEAARGRVETVIAEVGARHGRTLDIPIGVMIELPRAALTADALAAHADFFSFGTNDLTQTTWGISRDDAEASFLAAYREQGIISADPFQTLDEVGVGALVRLAVEKGRATRSGLELGVCGEHAGDPTSIGFFAKAGIDYLSCSPPRVPVARLEAGRQAVLRSAGALPTSDTR